MTDTTGGMPPAGWYPDPYGEPFERWWDGAGWTEHTNTPAPVASAAAEPVAPEAVAAEPAAAEYVAPQPVAYEPAAYEPAPYEPAPYEPAVPEPAAYEPPPLEEPPAATADPFAGFVSPAEPSAYEAPTYQTPSYETPAYETPAYETPAHEAPAETPSYDQPAFDASAFAAPSIAPTPPYEPAPYTPPTQGYDPEPVDPGLASDFFGQPASAFVSEPAAQQPPAAQSTNRGGANAASSFDFGFGDIIAGTTPSNASIPAQRAETANPGEDGLFGSWEPNEYTEPLRNGPANAGLTLGVLSFFLSALTGLPGLILSALGVGRAARFAREGAGPVGRGKAIAGLALSILGSAVSAAVILYGLQLFTASQQAADDETASETPDQTQVGEFNLEVGEMGTITLPDSEDAAIQFTVTAIDPNFTCTAADSVSPENGQFVAVTLSFTLSPDYATRMTDGAALHMYQSDWIGFLGEENDTQVDSTDAGNSCIAAAEQLPTDFPAGENVSGVIVLDMAPGTTSVSYAPSGVEGLDPGMTRWEWTVPA